MENDSVGSEIRIYADAGVDKQQDVQGPVSILGVLSVEDGELEVGRHVEGPEKAFTAIIAVQLISRQRRLWFVLCSNRHLQVQEYPWSYQSPSTSVRIFQTLLFLLFATYDVMLFVRVEKPPSLAMLQRFQTG